ncbi:copper-containing nitrite reductase [Halomonas sp. HP20-15]|uniref:copper-containing nitrite reductase n=1 Tax=Halomonas sp. HP20-15 TaxID=3085901 RepID=UPI002981F317|nr:copper-containing nitrite reductase [Halomonas sp. HP20-15]MDW5375624.1 copper-containing nitrite reductase [Halomonas sp. HP20-15]
MSYNVHRRLIATLVFFVIVLACQTGVSAQLDKAIPGDVKPDVSYTLRTSITADQLVFIGDTGAIKGRINPDLSAPEGAIVQINLINGDGAVHDIVLPEFDAESENVNAKGAATTVIFKAGKNGTFEYYCSLPGHKAAGMVGRFIVGEAREKDRNDAASISQNPAAVGQPVGTRLPRHVTLNLETSEVVGRLADGSSYKYWTFNGKVPGPLLRVRVGDKVTVKLKNADSSDNVHSIDLHAATGPGGGGTVTQVAPGQSKSFTFKALKPGLYVYHCATPMVAQHISNGMYGMILVEPEGGLPSVDKEFYVMQGELYTQHQRDSKGLQAQSVDKLLAENPDYFVFNGSVDALTKIHKMQVNVGDTVRIYFGVGGPNATSSFHVIGEIFDRVYNQASLTSPPLTDVQTTTVAPGGATMVEFKVDYPGRYMLVDHALARVEKGLVGYLTVEGEKDPEIFQALHKRNL